MIKSLLDNDFYKFTMMQCVLHQFPNTNVEYTFKCRNEAKWTEEILEKIKKEIKKYCKLQFTEDELSYLSCISFFKKDFIDFLRLYKPNINHIDIWLDDKEELNIIIKGSWLLTILFEVPILAIVNESYFEILNQADKVTFQWALEKTKAKKDNMLADFADFGTRRRYSFNWHEKVIKELKDSYYFIGTSNVFFARKYNLKPIGTMSHEFIMAGAGLENTSLVKSQQKMLQAWVDEYRGDLGIALTDTYGVDAFLKDFDLYFAKLYDGLRHDSGDPIKWEDKVINHYIDLKINPKSKTLVFSDGLTINKAMEIYRKISPITNVSFGIGTHLTNDLPNITPLQIVIKMTKCNGRPVAKISDSKGKGMCNDKNFLSYLKSVFK